MQDTSYGYKTEGVAIGVGRVKAHLRYPVGGIFGDFYAELAQKSKKWFADKYGEYSGRGITYRFFADILYFDGFITSVAIHVSIYEKGEGRVDERWLPQNWLADGRMLPMQTLLDKKTRKLAKQKGNEYCIVGGEILLMEKTGEKNPIGVKIGNLSQEILLQNLKNGT